MKTHQHPVFEFFKIPLKTEKEKLMHRLKTGHYMSEYICGLCLQASLDELCGGNVYPIVEESK